MNKIIIIAEGPDVIHNTKSSIYLNLIRETFGSYSILKGLDPSDFNNTFSFSYLKSTEALARSYKFATQASSYPLAIAIKDDKIISIAEGESNIEAALFGGAFYDLFLNIVPPPIVVDDPDVNDNIIDQSEDTNVIIPPPKTTINKNIIVAGAIGIGLIIWLNNKKKKPARKKSRAKSKVA